MKDYKYFQAEKKVGIVTRYDNNYGACLQAAALQKCLQKMNVTASIICFEPEEKVQGENRLQKYLSKLKKIGLRRAIKVAAIKKYIIKEKKAFDCFRDNEIRRTENIYHTSEAMQVEAENFDAFICGSDMIWCEEFIEMLDVYFLTFAPKGKRIAYSPSFGRNAVRTENRETYCKLIREMDYLSCRERSGLELITELTGRSAVHTIDPTLLLTRTEWYQCIPREKQIYGKQKYVLKYMFTELTKEGKKFVDDICQNINGSMRMLPFTKAEYILEKENGISGHGPYDFLVLYANSEFVVTNTFHGLIFALIFEKPFVVFKREDAGVWAKYDDRLTDILHQLGLMERYVSQSSMFKKEWLQLDYSEVRIKLNEWRDASKGYLFTSLNEAFLSEEKECD